MAKVFFFLQIHNLSFAYHFVHFHLSFCINSTDASSCLIGYICWPQIFQAGVVITLMFSFPNFTSLAEVKQNVNSYNGHLCGEQWGHTSHEFPLLLCLVCSSQSRSWWANGKVRVRMWVCVGVCFILCAPWCLYTLMSYRCAVWVPVSQRSVRELMHTQSNVYH